MSQRVTSSRIACAIAIVVEGRLSEALVYSPEPAKPSRNVIPVSAEPVGHDREPCFEVAAQQGVLRCRVGIALPKNPGWTRH